MPGLLDEGGARGVVDGTGFGEGLGFLGAGRVGEGGDGC